MEQSSLLNCFRGAVTKRLAWDDREQGRVWQITRWPGSAGGSRSMLICSRSESVKQHEATELCIRGDMGWSRLASRSEELGVCFPPGLTFKQNQIENRLKSHIMIVILLCTVCAPAAWLKRSDWSSFIYLFSRCRFTEFLEPFERVIQPEELWLYKNPLVESDHIPKRVMFVSTAPVVLMYICY